MYKYWIKLYNNDLNLLSEVIDTLEYLPDAVLFDINIANYYNNVYKSAQELASKYNFEIHIDPNTHKIRSSYYRSKQTYKKVKYFDGEIPSINTLLDNAKNITHQIIEYNKKLNSSSIISPYIYLGQDHFPDTKLVKLQEKYYEELTMQAPKGIDLYYSLCISADALCTPEAFEWIEDILNKYNPKKIYLILSDFIIGMNLEADKKVVKLIKLLNDKKIDVIYSHGPLWVYLLLEKGFSGFASGINYLSGFKKDYLNRESDIGGITHNIHISKKFCKLTPQNYIEAYKVGILDLCDCPACNNNIPTDTNSIRKHSIYARIQELIELNNSSNVRKTLTKWINESSNFISMAGDNEIDVIQDVPTYQLEQFLDL